MVRSQLTLIFFVTKCIQKKVVLGEDTNSLLACVCGHDIFLLETLKLQMFSLYFVSLLTMASEIAVVSFHDGFDVHSIEKEGWYSKYENDDHNATLRAQLCRANHETYCNIHNYDYINPKRNTVKWYWSRLLLNGKRFKMVLVLEALSKYKFVLWVDADTIFYRMNKKIEHWISVLDQSDKDIMFAEDIGFPYVFNSGVILMRSCKTSINFIRESIDSLRALPLTGLQDQRAMQNIYRNPIYRDRIHVVKPRRRFQAFAKLNEIRSNSWMIHFTCCNMKCGGKKVPSEVCKIETYIM